jgi:alpha-methylacyl-CoA racemase
LFKDGLASGTGAAPASVPATGASYQGSGSRATYFTAMDQPLPRRPLQGIRVVALATNIPGPLAAAQLAWLGAEVFKLEPAQGDALEAAAREWYAAITEGMRIERIDLRCSRARLIAHLANADLLITTMRPRALRAAELTWDELHETFPRLVHVAIVGERGENADRAGHDLTYQARAGLIAPPAMPRTVIADMFAAERALNAALIGLYARERTGEASRYEVAIADGAAALTDALRHGLTTAEGPLGGALPYYGLYRTADGWIALAALEPHFQTRLREVLDADVNDRNALAARFAEHPSSYWEAAASQYDLPIAAVS